MLRYLGTGVWRCPLAGQAAPDEDRVTGPVSALVRGAGQTARRHPRLAGVLLVLLGLTAAAGGGHLYVTHRLEAARIALRDGRLDDAQKDLALCLRVWPRSVPVHLLNARVLRSRGDLASAEVELNQCLKLQKGATEDIQLEFLLMRVQAQQVDEVEPQLMVYVDNQHRETTLILETLARAYMHNLRWRPALQSLDRWLKEDPGAARAYFWRGWVVEQLHDRDAAVEDYQRALGIDPNLTNAGLRLADLYMEMAQPLDALPHLERLRKAHPDQPQLLGALGRCKFMMGESREARPLLEAALEKLPEDPPLMIDLAKLDLQEDRVEEAEKLVRRVLEQSPFEVEAEVTLIDALRMQGRLAEAAEVQKKADRDKALLMKATMLLKDEAAHPSGSADRAYEIGMAFLQVGQDRVGREWLYQALDRDPIHRRAHEALAQDFEKKGDKERAAQHRRRLKELGASGPKP
jgi:Tfp pilus assembly protein PilF